MTSPRIPAGATAFVVVDLVLDYFDQAIWPDSVLPHHRDLLVEKTNELVGSCRRAGVPVIWVRQEFEPDLSDAFPHMRRSGKVYAIRGTAGCKMLPELHVAAADPVVVKKRFSAFFETTLASILTKIECKRIILAGITTAWCIRSTAVDAYQLGYDVLLAHECMSAFTVEDHVTSVGAMDGYIGRCCANGELVDALHAGAVPGGIDGQ